MSQNEGVGRRGFLKFAATALAVGPAVLAGLGEEATAAEKVGAEAGRGAAGSAVRVASVSTAMEGGLLPALVQTFKSESGLDVVLTRDDEPYGPAREGRYDVVISHFGHRDVQDFVQGSFGLWPQTVFSNQLCLAGPPSDPAKVRDLGSLVEAFRRIAEAKAPYVLNETAGLRYLTDILWHAAGKPAKGGWFHESGSSKRNAIVQAAEHTGYVLWGLTPFLREQKAAHGELVPLVTADPLLQRVMVSVAVNPERVKGVNQAGAARFQRFLLEPATQARILNMHYAGAEHAMWAPAGRHNAGRLLPKEGV